MNLQLEFDGNSVWTVRIRRRHIARLVMDYMAQVQEVILLPGITEDESLSVLRLAYSHAIRYVVERRYIKVVLKVTHRGFYNKEASMSVLKKGPAPEASKLDAEQLTTKLREIGIDVIIAYVNNLNEAIGKVVSDARVSVAVTFTIGRPNFLGEQLVTFQVESPAQFRVWHSVGKPRRSNSDLYIVPAYHPDQTPGKRSTNLINGDTNALIRGCAVRSVYAPPEAVNTDTMSSFSSWSYTNHPFYAAGSKISISASTTKSLSAEGIEEITVLLLEMLELDGRYLQVSGGFRSSYPYPENIRYLHGIRTSSWEGKARGSEGFCVWSYQVLKDEGELERAYIPQWFHDEGWLRAYENEGFTKP